MKINSKVNTLTALMLAAVLAACGGGSGSGGENSAPGTGTGTGIGGASSPSTDTQTSSAATLVTDVPGAKYGDSPLGLEKAAVFNQLNEDRARCGFGKLAQNTRLDAAAQAHADYLAANGYAEAHGETVGKVGYTGSTVMERLVATGYSAGIATENLGPAVWGTWYSSGESAVPYSVDPLSARNALRGLYATVYHLSGLMSGYRSLGIGVAVKDSSVAGSHTAFMKVLNVVSALSPGESTQRIAGDAVATFPCDGISGLNPYFTDESPDPFPQTVSRNIKPYGQPIYIASAPGTTLTIRASAITALDGATGSLGIRTLSASNDPEHSLAANEWFLVPTTNLAPNMRYEVVLEGTNSGMISNGNPAGSFSRRFTFSTGTFNSD